MSEYHDPDLLSDIAEHDRKEMEDYCSEYEAETRWMQEVTDARRDEERAELEADMKDLDDDYVRKLIYQGEDMSDYEADQNAK